MSREDWLVRVFMKLDEIDWIETACRAVFLIACIAIGTWIGS